MSAGEPYQPDGFDETTAGGIKVYIYKGAVASPDGIKISLAGDWALFHRLKAEGLIYEQPIAG